MNPQCIYICPKLYESCKESPIWLCQTYFSIPASCLFRSGSLVLVFDGRPILNQASGKTVKRWQSTSVTYKTRPLFSFSYICDKRQIHKQNSFHVISFTRPLLIVVERIERIIQSVWVTLSTYAALQSVFYYYRYNL